MIGQRIETQRGFPVAATLFGLLALGLFSLAAATWEPGFAVGGALPLVIALGFLLSKPPAFSGTFSEGGLELDDGETRIPYSSIIRVHGRKKMDMDKRVWGDYPLLIVHDKGQVVVPKGLNVRSDEIHHFLLDQIPPSGSREVHPELTDHLVEHLNEFGEDDVYSYRASLGKLKSPTSRRGLRVFCLGTMVGAVVWFVYGAIASQNPGGQGQAGWIAAGMSVAIFALVFFGASFASGSVSLPRSKKLKDASLVLSPKGLALVQGDVKGELRWHEVKDVKIIDAQNTNVGMFLMFGALGAAIAANNARNNRGILLKVKGAKITIMDIYDRPIYAIYRHIQNYSR